MSTAYQPIAPTFSDPTRGHNLVSVRAENLEQTRYLIFMGDLLDPNRQYEIEYLRDSAGGEEVQAHCLRRSVGGFIEKGRLTPVETWAEPMPPVLLGEGVERDVVRVTGPMTPENIGASARRPGGLAGVGAALVHVKFYPGDEIQSVLRANEGKGITEVKALAGQSWYADEAETEPGIAQVLNRDFFPTVPVELSKCREMIAKAEGRSDLHRSVARDYFAAANQFERYAQTRLAAEHTLLRQRTSPNGQHVYQYSPIAYSLLKQLEMKPQDNILDNMGGINAEQLQAIVSSVGGGQQIDPALIGQIAGEVARQMFAAQQATVPVDNRTPAEKRADTIAAKKAAEEAAADDDPANASELES